MEQLAAQVTELIYHMSHLWALTPQSRWQLGVSDPWYSCLINHLSSPAPCIPSPSAFVLPVVMKVWELGCPRCGRSFRSFNSSAAPVILHSLQEFCKPLKQFQKAESDLSPFCIIVRFLWRGKTHQGEGGGGRGGPPGWENWVGSHRGVVNDGWMTTLFSLWVLLFPGLPQVLPFILFNHNPNREL